MFNLGYLFLIFATATTLAAMLAYLPGVWKGKGRPLLKIARPAVYLTCAGLMASAGMLWYLILTHQYQYDYVFRYTSSDMPLRYVVSAFWGGQEGTFLLWALYGGFLSVFLRFKARQYEAPVLFFYMGINLFLMFMLLKASPFNKLPGVPGDGNGLNPLLQDPWMTIHPPVMFFGFASLGIPAAFAMAAMVKEDWDDWVRRAIPWTLFGVMALGTGLVMGGYWAYSILGWGGFWGWDPVENSSLVPWLVAVALLHNQVIQMKRGVFRRSNLFLAMMPFILLTYSTFLTRSGVLADFSVHSFTDLGINQFLVAFMVVFLGGGLGLFILKFRRIPTEEIQSPLLSREYFMFLGALAFGLFGLFVLLGTSAPLLTRISGSPANVQPEFYNRMGLPFAVLIAVLLSIGPFLAWRGSSLKNIPREILIPAALALVVSAVIFLSGVHQVAYLLLFATAVFALLANLWIVVQVIRRSWAKAGGYLAHVGIGLAIVGILASTAFSEKSTVVLNQDEESMVLGYGFTYIGNRVVENGRKNAYDVTLRTANGLHIISPTMYFSDFTSGMMKKPDIQSFWMRDVYVAPIGHAVDPIDERVETKFVLTKDQPLPGFGMEFVYLGMETSTGSHEGQGGHGHAFNDITGKIMVRVDGREETIEPVLRSLPDGHTEVQPADIPGTGYAVNLLAVDTSGGHAQIGVRRPPVALTRGQSAELQDAVVTFNGFDVEMGTRKGGSVKVFASAEVDMGGEHYTVRPGLISRPGAEELELVEAPLGRTGLNLVLSEINSGQGTGFFYILPAPQEYFYAEISLKPFIILLWIGTMLTVLGLALATFHRGRLATRVQAVLSGDRSRLKNGKREAA